MARQKLIHYGFGKDYLSNWGLPQAFREIYQNFLDYGDFENHITQLENGICSVKVINGWQPESLEFLRIGRSEKNGREAVGKHGEGLKMAFLILLREGLTSQILTPKYVVYPKFYQEKEIGDCFCLAYEEHGMDNVQFEISFTCNHEQFMAFRNDIISDEDIIFTHEYYGSIVEKPKGNIYSGGLFVKNVSNLQYAYDIKPSHLPLDRDRSMPATFDINWACSKIKNDYGKFTAVDLTHSDSAYIDHIPEEVKKEIKPVKVGNNVEFTYKDSAGTTQVISNDHVKEKLRGDGFFASIISKIKKAIAKQLGLYDMLVEFQNKHIHSSQAREDFSLILEKVGKKESVKQEQLF